jgi:hypothetical protein
MCHDASAEVSHCLLSLKGRKEDRRNTAPVANHQEGESDTGSGAGKGKRLYAKGQTVPLMLTTYRV